MASSGLALSVVVRDQSLGFRWQAFAEKVQALRHDPRSAFSSFYVVLQGDRALLWALGEEHTVVVWIAAAVDP